MKKERQQSDLEKEFRLKLWNVYATFFQICNEERNSPILKEKADVMIDFISAQIQKAHQDGYAKGRIKCLEQHFEEELEKVLSEKAEEILKESPEELETKNIGNHYDLAQRNGYNLALHEVKQTIKKVLSILKQKR